MLRVLLKSSFLVLLMIISVLSGCTETGTIAKRKATIVSEAFGEAVQSATIRPVDNAWGGWAAVHPIVSEITDAGGDIVGYTVRMQVVSRSGPFTILVAVGPDLCVRRAEVLEYRGERGRDVRSPRFTSQFAGKCANDPIELGNDIHAVSGATISSRFMTEGVKNAVRIVKSILTDSRPQ